MRLFPYNLTPTSDEALLKTAIELYQKDRERAERRRGLEQVLCEVDIPLHYLDLAKSERLRLHTVKADRRGAISAIAFT